MQDDQERESYRDVLGMELISLAERDPEFLEKITGIPGAHLKTAYLRAPGGHHLELIQYFSPPGAKLDTRTHNVGNAHRAFNVDDLPKLYADWKAKGVQFKSPPWRFPAGLIKVTWLCTAQIRMGLPWNLSRFEKLKGNEDLIVQACRQASNWATEKLKSRETKLLADLQRKGMQVVIPDAEVFREKGKPAVEALFQQEWPVTTWKEILAQ